MPQGIVRLGSRMFAAGLLAGMVGIIAMICGKVAPANRMIGRPEFDIRQFRPRLYTRSRGKSAGEFV